MSRRLPTYLLYITFLFSSPTAGDTPLERGADAERVEIVIVIDDIGYNLERAKRMIAWPHPLTLSLLPYAPHVAEIAALATRAGKEVLLHQPMEPLAGRADTFEPGMLHASMRPEHFTRALEESLDRVPHAVGVNNHTGSLLTARAQPMGWLMHTLHVRGLLFLDSRTTKETVAEQMAHFWNVPVIRRNVFLDNVLTEEALETSLARAVHLARKNGYAVVVAHPHALTLEFLESALFELPVGVGLTSLVDLVGRAGIDAGLQTQPPAG